MLRWDKQEKGTRETILIGLQDQIGSPAEGHKKGPTEKVKRCKILALPNLICVFRRDLELISKQCTADENECNAALSAYKTLDATFGPQYRILQKLMDQSDWNFATFELLIKEQSEISKRAQKIGNSDDHKLRAREMAALRKEHQQLQQVMTGLLAGISCREVVNYRSVIFESLLFSSQNFGIIGRYRSIPLAKASTLEALHCSLLCRGRCVFIVNGIRGSDRMERRTSAWKYSVYHSYSVGSTVEGSRFQSSVLPVPG